MKIADKTILLTGATGGLGQAIAAALAERGATVILTGRKRQALERLQQQLPGSHPIMVADLGKPLDRQALLAFCQQQGGIDILINNAGISDFCLLEQQADEQITAMLETNLSAPILMSRLCLPLLNQRREAAVVNIGSTFGSIGHTGFSVYCAGKFGLRGFTEALRRELADTGIKAMYIAPRATRTAINSDRVMAMNRRLGNKIDPPAIVAASVIKAIEKDRLLYFIGWPEKLFVRLNALLPAMVDSALRKKLAVIKQYT